MTASEAYHSPPTFAAWAAAEIDLRFWQEALAQLEAERQKATPEAIRSAHEFAIRAAAVDTAAIEDLYSVDRGFTFSVAAQTGTWQHHFDERGEKARAVFEDQLRAFELVLDAATGHMPVVEAVIRSLHQLVCASQETYRVLTDQGWQEQQLESGAYKTHPNNPRLPDGSQFQYAPPHRVKEEMERLVAELASPAFTEAPAPLQAAYAHYAFVAIHPFADGNGRVARALSSIYLVRATSVPLVVFADQKPGYLDALAAADRGNWGEFSGYVRDRSMDALNLAATGLLRARVASTEKLQGRVSGLQLSRREFMPVARRLLAALQGEVKVAFEELKLPPRYSSRCWLQNDHGPDGRLIPTLVASLSTASPQASSAILRCRALLNKDPDHPLQVRLEAVGQPHHLDARLDELRPVLSSALLLRLRQWSGAMVGILLEQVTEETARKQRKDLERWGWEAKEPP